MSNPESRVAPPGARDWLVSGREVRFGSLPLLMGILNVTPDSFSDGGSHFSVEQAVDQGLKLVADGADILDVGGESTRPQSTPVPVEEELRRVVPVVRALAARVSVPISIDTTKAAVARAAVDAGATIVNDISGLTFDPEMTSVCRGCDAGIVCMHIRGTPQTMQIDPRYDDCLRDVTDWLRERLERLAADGIDPRRVALDPGIGFGKTPRHNVELLSGAARLHEPGRPLLVGHSRKRFLGKLLGRTVDERDAGTVGVAIALAQQGVEMIRVHDVRIVRDALVAWHAVASYSIRPPAEAP